MMLGRVDGVIDFDYLKNRKVLVRKISKHILLMDFAELAPVILYLSRKM